MNTTSILLVDNNRIALKEMRYILKSLKYTNLHEITSTTKAWEAMRAMKFDSIISAWAMPEMSGLAFLKVVRGDDTHCDTPFFLTHTAFTKITVAQAGLAGVTGLIVRPFIAANIADKIQSIGDFAQLGEFIDEENMLNEGMTLLKKKNYKQALNVFEKLTQTGRNAEYYYNIGYIKTAQEKYGEAIQAFRKATQLDRMFAKAFKAMGRVYQKMGDPKSAEKYMQKAVDIYLSSEKVQNAEDVLNEILEINPETLNVYNSLGVISRKRGDLKQALTYYHKALKVHPKEPNIHYNIGRLCLDMGDRSEARKHFETATVLNPDFKEAQEVLEAFRLGSL